MRPRCINETDDGSVELICQLHQPPRFAIPFRMRISKIHFLPFFEIRAFLLCEIDERVSIKPRESSDKCAIVAVQFITMELGRFLKERVDIERGLWTLGVACQSHFIPATEFLEGLLCKHIRILL